MHLKLDLDLLKRFSAGNSNTSRPRNSNGNLIIMANNVRKQLFVDPKVQGALVRRAVVYWGCCLVTVSVVLLCWQIVWGPRMLFHEYFIEMWRQFGPAIVASLLLLPIIAIDVVRTSNRFAGPIFRMRGAMRAAAKNGHARPLKFREGDFWTEVADEFNAMLDRFEKDGVSTDPMPPRSDSEDQQPVTVG